VPVVVWHKAGRRAGRGCGLTDWRDIPMAEINWLGLRGEIGRSAMALRRLAIVLYDRHPVEPYYMGCWSEMTLGQVADLGRRDLMRHNGFGDITLAALQRVIDLAAAGKLPVANGPAPDALRPTGGAV